MSKARAFIGSVRGLVWGWEDLAIAFVLLMLMSLPWVRLVYLAATR